MLRRPSFAPIDWEMCGIAGILRRGGAPVDPALLRRMSDALAHRGPDGEGAYVDDGDRLSVGLASRRLAVIDIPGGAQPMSTEDGTCTVVYNGELFNTDEVRAELQSAGHRFRSRCDTEVVLRGYRQWGDAVVERLNGMWAFAVWDAARHRLLLCRDRLGVKPLVYAETPAGLVFASEVKALVASGLVPRDLDPASLPHYLSFFAVPEPHSLVRGVRRLRAGHLLAADLDGARERQYWDCALPEDDVDRGADRYREEVGWLLEDAVRRRLVSDVPLGVLLSAGIDSNLVAAFAARHTDGPLRTFTIGFDQPGLDERGPARVMASALQAEQTEAELGIHDAIEGLPDLLGAYDEPGQSLLQTHVVSALAARDVTVALSGLGGDELFSAYPTHVMANLLAQLDRIPRHLRKPALTAASLAPSPRLQRLAELSAMAPDDRAIRRLMHQTDAGLRSDLLAPELRSTLDLESPARHLANFFERAAGRHPLNRMLYVYVKTYLPDELLRASDAMSMHHSLELRTPFLDYRLVEQAMRIPALHKMRGTKGKLPLRDIAREALPAPVLRQKRGFAPPLGRWMSGELQERVRDTLADPVVARRGVFDRKQVEQVVSRCIGGDERLLPPVMMLYCFEAWAQRWLDGDGNRLAEPAQRPTFDAPEVDLSVVIVNWNTRERLRDCLASLEEHLCSVEHEVIVVDNASHDGSGDMVAADFPDVRLVRNDENVGFGTANNQAMRIAQGRWFL